MLEIPRREIEAYARERKLEWIEDESNADRKFDRNFLRHEVLPVIARRYPAYAKTLLRASRNCAEAAHLLDELAATDMQLSPGGGLLVARLRTLTPARAKNVVRYFLARNGVAMPNAARLDECVRQVLEARRGTRSAFDLGEHELRRYAGELRVLPTAEAPTPDLCREWHREARLMLPELGGTLVMKKDCGAGIDLAKLIARPVTVRLRRGGERFRPDPKRPRRSLKNLLQEAGVPPWQRARLPLLYGGETLVWAPGIGIACDFRARPGKAAIQPEWRLKPS